MVGCGEKDGLIAVEGLDRRKRDNLVYLGRTWPLESRLAITSLWGVSGAEEGTVGDI
jgi:hypothetical protein